MDQRLKWLPDGDKTPWKTLGEAKRGGLPVPAAFIVFQSTPENDIRSAYEDLKRQEKTHFVAVRGGTHAVLNVVYPDALIHTVRRFWAESPDAPVLIQRMIPATSCGKAEWHRKSLKISANEGMMLLDPDTYILNTATTKCTRRTLEPKQRKMIRHVDGTGKVVDREGPRTPMPEQHLAKIMELAIRAGSDIGWAVDDQERVWLLSRTDQSQQF